MYGSQPRESFSRGVFIFSRAANLQWCVYIETSYRSLDLDSFIALAWPLYK